MTESDIQRDIIAAYEAVGAVVMRMNAGHLRVGGRSIKLAPPGTPDLFVIGKRRSLWVEVKKPGGELRPDQIKMIDTLRDRGHEVIVARGIDDLSFPV